MAVLAEAVLDTTANVTVTAPSAAPAGGWPLYSLTLCTDTGCTEQQQSCTPAAGAGNTTCALTGLLSRTQYTVKVAGVAAGAGADAGTSLQSSADLRTRIS